MKKLTLGLDALCVESFATSPAMRPHGGTVRAHGFTENGGDISCDWRQSCMYVCESGDCPTRVPQTCLC